MGSLMAGWDSPVPDPKSIHFVRNKSMTKEEIATYWRSKKNREEEHGFRFSEGDQENEKIYRWNSLPEVAPTTKEKSIVKAWEEDKEEESKEKLLKKHGWWINSNWAFLNEPPMISSDTPFRYASQFHVAHKHINSDPQPATNGIRT